MINTLSFATTCSDANAVVDVLQAMQLVLTAVQQHKVDVVVYVDRLDGYRISQSDHRVCLCSCPSLYRKQIFMGHSWRSCCSVLGSYIIPIPSARACCSRASGAAFGYCISPHWHRICWPAISSCNLLGHVPSRILCGAAPILGLPMNN